MTYRWTGTLRPTPEGGVEAVLTDSMGFEIAITGERVAGGYELVGVPGKVPGWAALPGDEK